MPALGTNVDPASDDFKANRAAMVEILDHFNQLTQQALEGGGEKYVQRHRDRGKLLARESSTRS